MITITNENRKEKMTFNEKDLKKVKKNLNYVGADSFCEIVISFIYGRKKLKKSIIKIQKCLSSSGYSAGDVLKEYENQIISENEIVLKEADYKEVSRIIKNMSKKDTKRKRIIIDSYAMIIAYECNRYFILSELEDEVDIDFIFKYVCCTCLYASEKIKYKREILKRAKEILKDEYKVDLDYVFNGGKEK